MGGLILFCVFALFLTASSRNHSDPVSSHVLDTMTGLPAEGITITMFSSKASDEWEKIEAR